MEAPPPAEVNVGGTSAGLNPRPRSPGALASASDSAENWLPYMILPIEASLERVPASLVDASADLGATPRRTFRRMILPLALPGVVAGSIFTFSLTFGDFIVPQIIGSSRLFLGQVVFIQQGTAGNVPLAAAFCVVPIVVMAAYLAVARRLGALDAL
jgi:putative spermidine/putrescine transport system permease protein